jgi:hypothetical protein
VRKKPGERQAGYLSHIWRKGTAASPPFPATEPPARVKDFRLSDPHGKPHTPEEWHGKRAVVLFFLRTECPVSNGYAPVMEKLFRRFGPKGVAFYFRAGLTPFCYMANLVGFQRSRRAGPGTVAFSFPV